MNYLFDYGEFLLCIGPVFIVIAGVGFLLLLNSRPSNRSSKNPEDAPNDLSEMEPSGKTEDN